MAEEEFSAACVEIRFPEGTLLGHYRLDSFTAFSSTGEIYSATDRKDQKSCSVHVISSAVSGSSPDAAARLLSKAQKACFFHHKNFVSIVETLTLPEGHCIVTEALQGRSLRELVEQGLPPSASPEKILSELVALLAAAEKTSLDIEFAPEDIFITPEGDVKYLYPGIGSRLHTLSGAVFRRHPELRETVRFIAPEILLGKSKSAFAGSVYSLGMIFHYILSKGAFDGESSLYRFIARALEGACDAGNTDHASLLRRLTAKDPGKRPRSGRELLTLTGSKKKVPWFSVILAVLISGCCLAAGGVFLFRKGKAGHKNTPSVQTVTKKRVVPAVEKRPAAAGALQQQGRRISADPLKKNDADSGKSVSHTRLRKRQLNDPDKKKGASERGEIHGKKARDPMRRGELAAAVRQGDLKKFKSIIDAGFAVDTRLFNGDTPLIAACRANQFGMVKLLLDKKADVNKKSLKGETPLATVFFKSPEIFELLVSRGADTSEGISGGNGKKDSFMHALCFRYKQHPQALYFAEIMLKSGKFKYGRTELFQVCTAGSAPLFRVFMRYEKDFKGREYRGLLQRAIKEQMPDDIIRHLRAQAASDVPSQTAPPGKKKAKEVKAAPVSRKEPPKALPVRQSVKFGEPVRNRRSVALLRNALINPLPNELESLLKKGISPDSIVNGKTLLQHAVLQKKKRHVMTLLRNHADPFKVSPQDRRYPEALCVMWGDMELFRQFILYKKRNEEVHDQVLNTIFYKDRVVFFLREYLERYSSDIRRIDLCYLTEALAKRVSKPLAGELLKLYPDLRSSKHRSVIHQAVASNYTEDIIKLFIDKGAPVLVSAPVFIKGHIQEKTPLETAAYVKAPQSVFRVLKKAGAK